MRKDVEPPMMLPSQFNIFEVLNFRTYELLPRWEPSDPDPAFMKNMFRSPQKIAWHSRYQSVYPHSLQYMALRHITKDELQDLSVILKDPRFDINAPIDKKYLLNPIQYAAYTNKYPIIELLLLHGANINATDREGNTPLMMAVKKECLESINSLMKNGCDRGLSNVYGMTPAQKAREMESEHMADFIEQYPLTNRKFPKVRVRLDIEAQICNDPVLEFIKNYPLYLGKVTSSPFNNFSGDYRVHLTNFQTVADQASLQHP